MGEHEESKVIRRFFTMGQSQSFGKGDTIVGNDPEPDGVYFINSGYIKMFSLSDSGDEFMHIVYGHGELFPLIWAYLGTSPDSVYYQAISDTVTWRMSRSWFSTLASTNPALSFALSVQLAQQFQVFTDRIENLEYKKAKERVAYRLVFLASRFGIRTGSTVTIDSPITHELFANSVNLARETVSRTFEQFEKEHIIKTSPQRIAIIDMPALIGKMSRPNNLKNWKL